LLIEVQKLAHLVQLEEIVVLAGFQAIRILVVLVAGVQTLLLRFELDAIVRICLLLLLTKEQVHRLLQLLDLVYGDSCLLHLALLASMRCSFSSVAFVKLAGARTLGRIPVGRRSVHGTSESFTHAKVVLGFLAHAMDVAVLAATRVLHIMGALHISHAWSVVERPLLISYS